MSEAVNTAIEFCRRTKSEYHTLSYPVYRGISYPRGTYREGCKWREGFARLLPLRRVTSRLISFHFLSFHPRASISPARKCKVHMRVRVNGVYSIIRLSGNVGKPCGKMTLSFVLMYNVTSFFDANRYWSYIDV